MITLEVNAQGQTVVPRPIEDEINDLHDEIQQLQHEAEQLQSSALMKAKLIGEKLVQAKKQVVHGEWMNWIKDNLKFSHQTAKDYMKLVNHWDEIEKEGAALHLDVEQMSIRDALKVIEPQPMTERQEQQRENNEGNTGVFMKTFAAKFTMQEIGDFVDSLADRGISPAEFTRELILAKGHEFLMEWGKR